MLFRQKQIFLISLMLSFCMLFAPFAQEAHAEGIFSKLKEKATTLIDNTVKKYTSRDFWVDKATDTVTNKVVAKPVKLATAALGIAIGTAIGGPIGTTLGAYIGNKIGSHACSIIAKPIVKGVINDKLDNGGSLSIGSIYKVAKNIDMPQLACDTTGAVVGDIVGSAIGGIAGAAIMACVGGGTILPIIGTLTFAKLGSKYGERLGNWLGKKFGENAFNSGYKALTGVDRTEGQNDGKGAIASTIADVKAVNKTEVARSTTGEIVGDVIGSALGTVAGATLSAFGTMIPVPIISKIDFTSIGEKTGSKYGSKFGNWIGTKFFDKSKETLEKATKKNRKDNVSATVMENTSTYSSADLEAAYQAYLISYDNYAKALSDSKTTNDQRLQRQKEYNACYEMYKRLVTAK